MDPEINIVCWKWHPITGTPGTKKVNTFSYLHVNALYHMLQKHVSSPFRLICVTDDFEGILPEVHIVPLWDQWRDLGGCFTRLVCFKKDFALFGERFTSIDLDCVIVGDITDILLRKEDFIIWKPENDLHRIASFCGSLWTLTAGMCSQVYSAFNPHARRVLRKDKYVGGTDQLHISKLFPNADTYTRKDGVYNFVPDIFRGTGELPEDAKIVFFNGRFMPDELHLLTRSPWIAQYYPLAGTNKEQQYSPRSLRALRRYRNVDIQPASKFTRTVKKDGSVVSIVLFWWNRWPDETNPALGVQYIERLITDIRNNISSQHEYQIVLFTDVGMQIPGVSVRTLNTPTNLRWNLRKMYMYSEEARLSGYVICFDLDTVIRGSIDLLIEQVFSLQKAELLITCEAAYKKGQIGGSIIGFIPSLKLTELLWVPIIRDQLRVEARTKGSERLFYRQQLLTTQVLFWEQLIPGKVVSYKKDCQNGIPTDASVVRFHGQPRPHDVIQFERVK